MKHLIHRQTQLALHRTRVRLLNEATMRERDEDCMAASGW